MFLSSYFSSIFRYIHAATLGHVLSLLALRRLALHHPELGLDADALQRLASAAASASTAVQSSSSSTASSTKLSSFSNLDSTDDAVDDIGSELADDVSTCSSTVTDTASVASSSSAAASISESKLKSATMFNQRRAQKLPRQSSTASLENGSASKPFLSVPSTPASSSDASSATSLMTPKVMLSSLSHAKLHNGKMSATAFFVRPHRSHVLDRDRTDEVLQQSLNHQSSFVRIH